MPVFFLLFFLWFKLQRSKIAPMSWGNGSMSTIVLLPLQCIRQFGCSSKCHVKDKLTKYMTETQIYTWEYIEKCTASSTVVSTVVQYRKFVYLGQTMADRLDSWNISIRRFTLPTNSSDQTKVHCVICYDGYSSSHETTNNTWLYCTEYSRSKSGKSIAWTCQDHKFPGQFAPGSKCSRERKFGKCSKSVVTC